MPLEAITEFPHDFHGYKLIKRLGGGFISEAYLAEVPEDIPDVPRQVCLKIFTDKTRLEPGRYTVESATEEFIYQRNVLRDIQHPFLVKTFSTILPEVKDCIPTELGLCTLEDLQASLDAETGPCGNHFHPIAVKYFAAQIFLALAHLHEKGIHWEDAKQANVIIKSDFTLRLIDVGSLKKERDAGVRDHYFLAGSLYNMSTTSSEEFLYQDLKYYKKLFNRKKQDLDPILQDLLNLMLKLETFGSLLGHPYWTNIIDGNEDTAVDLLTINNSEVGHLSKLQRSAWVHMSMKGQVWLTDLGLDVHLL